MTAKAAAAGMARFALLIITALSVAVMQLGCGGDTRSPTHESRSPGAESGSPAGGAPPPTDLGIDASGLSPNITNPYVAFAVVRRAVYEGHEPDAETQGAIKVRVEAVVRDTPETVAGVKVTVVEVSDFDEGKLAEKTMDYYAQDRSGVVYYIGERVDDFESGKIVGHGGQWLAGTKASRAGIFMPAAPKVGDVFEQERAPGVAQDRSTVIATGLTVTVPAGTFKDCIETEDFDPIGKTKQRKVYCRGVGLVREIFGKGRSLDLIELKTR